MMFILMVIIFLAADVAEKTFHMRVILFVLF